ncbi:MAG: hypothetical protein NC548_11200 [Lachnospiraceae bacterium]|nr:hypothetical protein [Lachnospiraceae bacterium]
MTNYEAYKEYIKAALHGDKLPDISDQIDYDRKHNEGTLSMFAEVLELFKDLRRARPGDAGTLTGKNESMAYASCSDSMYVVISKVDTNKDYFLIDTTNSLIYIPNYTFNRLYLMKSVLCSTTSGSDAEIVKGYLESTCSGYGVSEYLRLVGLVNGDSKHLDNECLNYIISEYPNAASKVAKLIQNDLS